MFELFHLHIIPMLLYLYKDIIPYLDKFIHVYGRNLSILWSPFRIWTPQVFKIAILGTQFLNPGEDPDPSADLFPCIIPGIL